MDNLKALLLDERARVNLDLAALELAAVEFPGLNPRPFLEILDSHAVELASLLSAGCDGAEFVEVANTYFYEELGFEGNQTDYYDPLNSCLNEVLARRTGIPITLGIVYLEVARRLAKPVSGVGLPGHFVLKYEDEEFEAFIDVFQGGRLLEADECLALATRVSGVDVTRNHTVLRPVGKRHILLRMLNNMRSIYLRRREYAKACEILNLLILTDPASPKEYVQRGIVNMELKRLDAAKADFETYLRLSPGSRDRDVVRRQIRALETKLASYR